MSPLESARLRRSSLESEPERRIDKSSLLLAYFFSGSLAVSAPLDAVLALLTASAAAFFAASAALPAATPAEDAAFLAASTALTAGVAGAGATEALLGAFAGGAVVVGAGAGAGTGAGAGATGAAAGGGGSFLPQAASITAAAAAAASSADFLSNDLCMNVSSFEYPIRVEELRRRLRRFELRNRTVTLAQGERELLDSSVYRPALHELLRAAQDGVGDSRLRT